MKFYETNVQGFNVKLIIEPETRQAYPYPDGIQVWVGFKAYALVGGIPVGDKFTPVGVGYQINDKPSFDDVCESLAYKAFTSARLRRLIEVPGPLPMTACSEQKPYSGQYPEGFPGFESPFAQPVGA